MEHLRLTKITIEAACNKLYLVSEIETAIPMKKKASKHPIEIQTPLLSGDSSSNTKQSKQNTEAEFNLLTIFFLLRKEKLPADEKAQLIRTYSKQLLDLSRSYSKKVGNFVTNLAVIADEIDEHPCNGELQDAYASLQDACDSSLAILAREPECMAAHRAPKTSNKDLLVNSTSAIHRANNLIDVIKREIQVAPNDALSEDGTLSYFADYVWDLVYDLTELCDQYPNAVHSTARGYPCWPTLQFRHKAGNSDFPRLADHINLGKSSIIDATEIARYHWRTPLNRYLLRTLWKVQGILADIDASSEKPIEEALKWRLKTDSLEDRISANELEVYKQAHTLGSLQKSNAASWADEVVTPLISILEEDYSKVPEFQEVIRHAAYPTRGCQHSRLKQAVKRNLKNMAPNGAN